MSEEDEGEGEISDWKVGRGVWVGDEERIRNGSSSSEEGGARFGLLCSTLPSQTGHEQGTTVREMERYTRSKKRSKSRFSSASGRATYVLKLVLVPWEGSKHFQ